MLALRESVQGRSNNLEGMEAQRHQDFEPMLRRSVYTEYSNPVMIVNQIGCQHRRAQGNLRQLVDRRLRSGKRMSPGVPPRLDQ